MSTDFKCLDGVSQSTELGRIPIFGRVLLMLARMGVVAESDP